MADIALKGHAMEEERTRLTSANEDYLEAIVRLGESQNQEEIRSVDIANLLNVSKASVNKALSTLRADGYIEQERYGRITLTPEGRAYGQEVWGRHQILRNFLIHELGVDYEVANEEACMMEHALSQDTMRKWLDFLKNLHPEGMPSDVADDGAADGDATVESEAAAEAEPGSEA